MDEYTPGYQDKKKKWEKMVELLSRALTLLVLLRNQGVEANNALWAVAEAKVEDGGPKNLKEIVAVFHSIRKQADALIEELKSLATELGVNPSEFLPEEYSDLSWATRRYQRMSAEESAIFLHTE